jgi:hypothetical protein
MGMSVDFIRKEFQSKKSRTIVQSNHNETVRMNLLHIKDHHREKKKF